MFRALALRHSERRRVATQRQLCYLLTVKIWPLYQLVWYQILQENSLPEFRVKLNAKTDISFQVQLKAEFTSQVNNFPWIAKLNKIWKKENIVWFYPEHALQKVISKSTVKTVIAIANKKQGQSNKGDFYLIG